jgi:hypothetical protein
MFLRLPECLKDLVGLHARCEAGKPAPKTGLYVDELAGITFETITHIANRDVNETGILTFEHIYQSATLEMCSEVLDKLSSQANLIVNNDLHARHIGYLNSNTYNPVANKMRGIRIRKRITNSPMQVIYINTINVLTNSTGTATVTIYERDNSVLSETVDVFPGLEATINLDYQTDCTDIKILMANNQLETADTWVAERNNISVPCCGGCAYTNDKYLEIAGWNGTGNDSKTFGLSADVGVRCDATRLFCNLSAHFGLALRFRIAVAIAEYAQFSSRINGSTADPDAWQTIKNVYQDKYDKALKVVIESVQKNIRNYDKLCVSCTGSKISSVGF